MAAIWNNAQPLIITTRGPGNLHLFTYQNSGNGVPIVGTATTTNTGVTRFMISFSHSYFGYAFYWEGTGEAVSTISPGLKRLEVGRSWSQACATTFGTSASLSTLDVSALVPSATNVGNTTTCFIIPDKT